MRPLLVDFFCKAGGAAVGFHRAGFDVIGVDIEPQPRYPFEFHQADALDVLREMVASTVLSPVPLFEGRPVAAVHGSPPCQGYSVTASLHTATYPLLIEPVRTAFLALGLPYSIENVVGAPLLNPIRLCGSSFGLGVRRHRIFEVSPPMLFAPPCAHHLQPEPIDVTGTGGPRRSGPRPEGGGESRKPDNLAHARAVMGIDWMTRPELSEAIPPAYTEFVGAHLLDCLAEAAA